MRILMLADFYPPVVGGLEQLVSMLSRDLVQRGHDVAVATIQTPGVAAFQIDQGVRVYRLRSLIQRFGAIFADVARPFPPPAPDPLVMDGLRRVVADVRPDVVHGHSWIFYSFLPVKKQSNARLVVTLHDYGLYCPRKDFLHEGHHECSGPGILKCLRCSTGTYGFAKAFAIETASRLSSHWHHHVDQFLAISSYVARRSYEHLRKHGGKIEIVPSFIADSVANYEPHYHGDLPLPNRDFILFVGALRKHKGVDVLLQAYEALHTDVPLVLIGSVWPDTPTTFPANVIVIKNAAHDLVMEAWARCLFGIAPSVWPEPLGLVALEALAMGRPVIASRLGGLTDVVQHERTGLLVTPGDVQELRHAMQTLLNDAELRTRLGHAGCNLVRTQFTASAVVPKLESVYNRLLH